MFSQTIAATIGGATLKQLDDLAGTIWKAWGSGHVTDHEAESLSASIEVRRAWLRGTAPIAGSRAVSTDTRPPLPRHLFPVRKLQRSPDRQRSIARRRSIAAAGVMPPALAAHFTVGELAALAIIASESGFDDACDLSIAEIAARAGIGRTSVQNAVRRAGQLGLLLMTERRRPGRPSLTNLIRIVSDDWKAWIKLGGRRAGSGLKTAQFPFRNRGFKKTNRTDSLRHSKSGRPLKEGRKKPSGPPSAVAFATSRP